MNYGRIIQAILDYRKFVLLLLGLAVAVGFTQIFRLLKVDNSLSIWFLDNNPAYQEYLQFQEEQGSDQIIIAMIPKADTLAKEHLQKLQQLHLATDSLPFINATLSLANVNYPLYANRKLYYRPVFTEDREIEWIENLLADLPAIQSQLLSKEHLFFYIQLDPTNVIEQNRTAKINQVVHIIRSTVGPVHITGPPILNEAYSTTIYEESNFFAATTIVVIVLLLLFLLPHWSYLPIALSCVTITVGVSVGLLVSMGYSLNLISMLIPTILMVYSISDSIHIINIFHTHRKDHPEQSRIEQIKAALIKSLKPCFYTTLTTVVGYLALYLSPLPAFKVTGFFTFLGIAIAFFVAYLVSIIGFYYLPEKSIQGSVKKINISFFVKKINYWTTHKNTAVLGIGFLVFILGGIGVSYLKVNTNSLNLLGEGLVKDDLLLIEKKLEGSARLQLNIARSNNQSLLGKSDLEKLEAFQEKLNNNPLLSHPVSIVNFKNFLSDRMPAFSRFSSINFTEVINNSEQRSNSFFSLFSKDYSQLAININIRELQTKDLNQLLQTIKKDFSDTYSEEAYQLKIHGFPAVYAQVNKFILQTQFRSFGAAFLVSFFILFYFIGDLKTAILALIPNLLPLALTLFIMALFHIDLEAGNAMLAPIMLGVAMDDTIHLMNKYRKNISAGLSVTESMDRALAYTGGALFSTTIALVCGFAVVGFSSVASVSTFGVLCSFTILSALLADVIFLPALMKRFLGR